MRAPLSANARRVQLAQGASIPAPIGGWDAVSALADMPENRAVVLDNWIPRNGFVEVRRGFVSSVTGCGSGVVDSLMVYMATTVAASKMFSGANNTIYDVSASGAASEAVTSLNSNRFQYINFTTPGAKYLWVCNGADDPRHFDGSSWATPSLSITTYSASDIINVNAHKSRIWVVFKDSTVAGYLPVNSVAGTISNFDLGPQFTKGGYLVAMGTWTRDGGAGSDDLAVFISSQGQAAVYQGTDPSDSQLWNLIGVFDIGPPLGYRCFVKVGGDLALLNMDGVVPISQALQTDRGAIASVAITGNINNAMNDAARSYSGNFGWQLMPYPKGTYVIVNIPVSEGATQHQYVMNTLSGAWCRFTGQDANCWAVYKDHIYFGGNDGTVYKADTGGIDGDLPIDAIGQGAYTYLKSKGRLKQMNMIQPLLTTDSDSRPAIGISTDFKDNAVLGTPSAATTTSALYDVAVYDVDVYAVEGRNIADWTTAFGNGQCFSVLFRAQTSSVGDAVMRLNGFNVDYELGGIL